MLHPTFHPFYSVNETTTLVTHSQALPNCSIHVSPLIITTPIRRYSVAVAARDGQWPSLWALSKSANLALRVMSSGPQSELIEYLSFHPRYLPAHSWSTLLVVNRVIRLAIKLVSICRLEIGVSKVTLSAEIDEFRTVLLHLGGKLHNPQSFFCLL